MRLQGKTVLITGAGAGIGRAVAIMFAAEGAKITVVDIDALNGEKTVESIKQKGGEAQFVKADVTIASDVERAIQKTIDIYGNLDVLHNNAGLNMVPTPVEDIDEALWDKMLAINLKGVFLGCKYAVPIMKKQGAGVIINTASITGVRPLVHIMPYTAAKAGVIMLTKALAIELAPFNIRVNCISPVMTEGTPQLIRIIGNRDEEEARDMIKKTIPLRRLGKPEDIAYAAVYLASDEASYVTGANWEVCGGRGV